MSTPSDNAAQRILVIDDDRKLCRLIRDYLEPMGYEVEAVHTGPEGAELATCIARLTISAGLSESCRR